MKGPRRRLLGIRFVWPLALLYAQRELYKSGRDSGKWGLGLAAFSPLHTGCGLFQVRACRVLDLLRAEN